MSNTIIKRQQKEKLTLIENLKKIPIIEIACNKSGVGRASYYRWRNQFSEFAKEADKAIDEGVKLINDIAESQLLTAIKDGNISAIFYWLNHRHNSYRNKVEITGDLKHEYKLSDEEEKIMIKALEMITKQK